MPLGSGYFLNSATGEEVEAYEHLGTALKDPARFGLAPASVKHFRNTPENRKELLTRVIRNGWIRVRMYKNAKVFECWRINDDVLFTILEFAHRHHMWDSERISIHELIRRGGMNLTVGQLKQQLSPGEFAASLTTRREPDTYLLEIRQAGGKKLDWERTRAVLVNEMIALNENQKVTAFLTEEVGKSFQLKVINWDSEYPTGMPSVQFTSLIENRIFVMGSANGLGEAAVLELVSKKKLV